MAKPKKIVLKSDDLKRFGAEVFDLVRTKLAPKIGGNVNLGVKLAAEHFAPRKPGEVTVVEMETAIPVIAAKFEVETKRPSGNDDGRLPLNDEAQKLWDSGQWRGKLTVHGLRKKFEAEIGDNVDLTVGMIDAYAAELATEKARVTELVSEHDDPDSRPMACESPVHRGEEREFQPTVAFRLERTDDGALVRRKHDQGDEYMEVGNFLIREEEADRISYCKSCREAARVRVREAKEQADALRHQLTTASAEEKPKLQKALADAEELANIKLTFYTASGSKRKLDAMKNSAEGNAALAAQLKSVAARTFGGSGTRSQRDWRTTRRPRGR